MDDPRPAQTEGLRKEFRGQRVHAMKFHLYNKYKNRQNESMQFQVKIIVTFGSGAVNRKIVGGGSWGPW